MKISLNWLRDFIDCNLTAAEMEALFRRAGLEVAEVEERGAAFDKVVVAVTVTAPIVAKGASTTS